MPKRTPTTVMDDLPESQVVPLLKSDGLVFKNFWRLECGKIFGARSLIVIKNSLQHGELEDTWSKDIDPKRQWINV